MSIDQHRKKGMRGRKPGDAGGYGTIPDGFGYNDPFCLSIGHPSDKTDPESIYKIHHDGDVRRRSHAEYCSARGGRSDYTKP